MQSISARGERGREPSRHRIAKPTYENLFVCVCVHVKNKNVCVIECVM